MKLVVYGMPACSNCVNAKNFLDANNVPYMYLDLSESVGNMKKFLKLRDHEALFEEVRASGRIGIPCFLLEDGTLTFDLNEVLEKMGLDIRFDHTQC